MDDGKLSGVLFIDLRKAIDKVNHKVFLHKLKSFEICQNVLSREKNISLGVPKGSISGVLCFILYITDYSKRPKHSVTMYAEDASQNVNDKSNM